MSRIVKGIFGGSSSSERILQRFNPAGFTSAGGSASFNRGTNSFRFTRSGERTEAISNVVDSLRGRAAAFAGLRGDVRPGFGRLSQARQAGTRARIDEFRANARRSVGNIREGLARRRLAGSSFQASEVARAEAEFARGEDLIRAESQQAEAEAFIQEIGLTMGLIGEQFDASTAAFETILQELNLDTQIAATLASQSSELMQRNITAQAEARAAQQAAGESFIDNILGLF